MLGPIQLVRDYCETFESTSRTIGTHVVMPSCRRHVTRQCPCASELGHIVAMARGRGGKKWTTAGDDPPGIETEAVAVKITPTLPAKRTRNPSVRKSAAAQESQRSRQRQTIQKVPATPVKEPDSAAVPITESPSKTIMESPSKTVMESPTPSEVPAVGKDTDPTTWLATTATLHERTMLTKASNAAPA